MRDRRAPLSRRSGFLILPRRDAAILRALPEVRWRAPPSKNVALIPCSRALRSAAPQPGRAREIGSDVLLTMTDIRGVAVVLLDDDETADTSGVSVLLPERL
jgi:hypothetical protein